MTKKYRVAITYIFNVCEINNLILYDHLPSTTMLKISLWNITKIQKFGPI